MFYLVVPLYLIEILHQTTTATGEVMKYDGCILLKFYIKPQPSRRDRSRTIVVSYWNSTSNHNWTPRRSTPECVVSYWNSTSNHNGGVGYGNEYGVVSYWNSTSNHNQGWDQQIYSALYLIEILHQTTTGSLRLIRLMCCILLKFYIKPQRTLRNFHHGRGCILLKFYIKPQQTGWYGQNNNCCILLKFYIKPQPPNHPILFNSCCILLKFYIKPQLQHCGEMCSFRCILLKFYIKPQQDQLRDLQFRVVSYWNSTSNHNRSSEDLAAMIVVSYWNSTSNHNCGLCHDERDGVVSYWNSTSNHNHNFVVQ